ncbi:MAG TPA: cytochrome c3 family protein [Anaeromyxobacteraceae bacterium]|nr:cytochrome c3 family protein [Anaeromyxobacteraceae bacterium]
MRRLYPILLLALAALPARAAIPAEQDSCLGCHGSDPTMTMDLPGAPGTDGKAQPEKLALYVDQDAFAKSVHGDMLKCTDCHTDMSDYPHDSKPFKTKRDVTVAFYEQCKKCHFSNYTKTLDGVHYQLAQKGNRQAALCVDCHGSHAIGHPGEPRTRVSSTCAGCHKKVADTFAKSVHGKALTEGNPDVPVCTDCHRAHDVADPRSGALSLRTADICGRCHTDEKLMKRYGLSTKVVDTYLSDFHGMEASLQKGRKSKGDRLAAGCTDCHGVHNIMRPSDPTSTVLQANLVQTCRKCHPEATANFPKAWMSHYEPSLKKSPLVWSVQLFYYILIPFILLSLVIQIALHLWRVVVNR